MPSAPMRFLRALGLGALAAFAYGLLRSTREQATPAPTGTASWPPLTDAPPPTPRSGPVRFTAGAVGEDTSPGADDDAPTDRTWIESVDGGCPGSHPIKGNADSMIFHVPGGRSYERTAAERCYCTAADAEADGFRQAKR